MKRELLTMAICLIASILPPRLAAQTLVDVDEEHFPDPVFRDYLIYKLNKETDNNNAYADNQINVENVRVISCANSGIKNLKGIELFPNLGSLYCQGNNLIAFKLHPNAKIGISALDGQFRDLDNEASVDLAILDSSFDPKKVIDIKGATLNGTTLTFNDGSYVASYTYKPIDSDPGRTMKVTVTRRIPVTAANFPDENFRNYLTADATAERSLNKDNKDKTPYDEATNSINRTNVKIIYCQDMGIKSLKGIELFPNLGQLHCNGNNLIAFALHSDTDIWDSDFGGIDSPQIRELGNVASVDFVTLDSSFDPTKVTELKGATLSGTTLTFNDLSFEASYTYKPITTKPDRSMKVTVTRRIPVTEEYFPDENFRNYLTADATAERSLNKDNSDKTPYDEATNSINLTNVELIDCQKKEIKSLKGIELFPNLGRLFCQGNNLIAFKLHPDADIWASEFGGIDTPQIRELDKTTSTTGSIDLATLDNSFDPDKVTDLEGATLNGTTLTFNDYSYEASYTYQPIATEPDRLMKVEIIRYAEGIDVTETNFPDPVFRKFLKEDASMKKYYKASTNTISLALNKMEIGYIYDGTDENNRLKDLSGIEKFVNLQVLNINDRKVGESLATVKLPTSLMFLYCSNVKGLSKISNLDKLTNLEILNISNNKSLTTLDVSKNTKLKKLSCGSDGGADHETNLESLTLPADPSTLEEIDCSRTKLPALDLSKCTGMKFIKINYAKSLASLTLPNPKDASTSNILQKLTCDNCQLTKLDLTNCGNLRRLECSNNLLTKLDLTPCGLALDTLDCGNPLVFEDVNYNNYGREAANLNISANTNLKWLNCMHANVKELDLSKHTQLEYINCGLNRATPKTDKNGKPIEEETDTEPLTLTLPTEAHNLRTLNCGSNNLTTELNDVGKYEALEIFECANNNLKDSGLNIKNNKKLWYLYARMCHIKELDVSENKELRHLTCSYNDISKLDVTQNTHLTSLNCNNNRLEVLDLYYNTELDTLHVENNHLIALDLTRQTGMFDIMLTGQTRDLGTGRHFNMNRRDGDYHGNQIQDAKDVVISSSFSDYTIDTSEDDQNFKTEDGPVNAAGTEPDNSSLADWLTFDEGKAEATYNYQTGGIYNADLATDPDKPTTTQPTTGGETGQSAPPRRRSQAVPAVYEVTTADGTTVKYALMDVKVTRKEIPTGISEVETETSALSIRTEQGVAIIDGAEGRIAVYTTAGMLAATATATDGISTRIPLPAGFYMVVTSTSTAKILVP